LLLLVWLRVSDPGQASQARLPPAAIQGEQVTGPPEATGR